MGTCIVKMMASDQRAPAHVAKKSVAIPADTLSKYAGIEAFKTTDGTACLPIRVGESGASAMTPTTLMALFTTIIEKGKGGLPAMRAEIPAPAFSKTDAAANASRPVEEWKTWTYQQYYDDSRSVAKAFISLGLDRYASVNIWGFNSPQWFLAEMGAIFAGGKAAGIYPTDTVEQVKYKIQHSTGQILCVEDQKKFNKLVSVLGELPEVKAVVCWAYDPTEAERQAAPCEVLTWDELMARGSCASVEEPGPRPAVPSDSPKAALLDGAAEAEATAESKVSENASAGDDLEATLEARIADQQPGHCCALIYTSGTTGQPKAVMISHDNIIFESNVVGSLIPNCKDATQERVLSYLPLSHVAGMLLDIVSPIYNTACTESHVTVHFARVYDISKSTIVLRLQAVQPTMFLGVPRVWEKIQDKMVKAGASVTGLKRTVATWAKEAGTVHAENMQLGGDGSFPRGYGFYEQRVHNLVKARLGLSQCKFAFTGAAPISVDTLSYFGALGIQINEVYGMSECTGATTWSTDACHIWGSCGFPMPSMEVNIFNPETGAEVPACTSFEAARGEDGEKFNGEICYRGRHIMMGYLGNPNMGEEHMTTIEGKLNDAIDDQGWLHSGDKGCILDSGMVKITGRYKELLIGAGGENVAPVPIEDAVKAACPQISNIMMFGNKKKFLAAMVTLKAKGANGEDKGSDNLDVTFPGSNATTITEAMADPAVAEYITKCIVKGNKAAPNNASTIKKFTILPHDFSVNGGEFTSTLKLKRSVAVEHFNEIAERTYTSDKTPYVPFNPAAES